MRSVVCTILCLVTLFAGAPSPGAADADRTYADVAIERTDRWTFDLAGTGWALVRITAVDDLDLNFTVTHDTIEDICGFTQDGDGIYDQGHVTVFQLWKDGDHALAGERFWWHGPPGWSNWPSQSGDCGESDPITLAAGDTAWFVAADTTGGYTATLTADWATIDTHHRALTLAPHAEFQRIDPTPTETATFSTPGVDVLRERTWTAPLQVGHSLIMFADWGHETGATGTDRGAYATLFWETKKLTTQAGPDNPYASVVPDADADVTSPNGRHRSMSVRATEITEPGEYEARYTRGEMTANIDSQLDVGAYAISVPLE